MRNNFIFLTTLIKRVDHALLSKNEKVECTPPALSTEIADRGNHSLNMESQLPEQGAKIIYTPRAPPPFRDSLCVRMSGIPGPNQRINEEKL